MPASNPIKVKCQHCGARYVMDEERIRGRVLRIRCKTCHEVFEVRGQNEPSLVSRGKRWFLALGKQRVGPVTTQEVRDRFARGEIKATTYVWRQGFSRWERLKTVAEFADLLARPQAEAGEPAPPAREGLAAASAPELAASAPEPAPERGGTERERAPELAPERGGTERERAPLEAFDDAAVGDGDLDADAIDRLWPEVDTAVVAYHPGGEGGELRAEYVRPGSAASAAPEARGGEDALDAAPAGELAPEVAPERATDEAERAPVDPFAALRTMDTLPGAPAPRVAELADAFRREGAAAADERPAAQRSAVVALSFHDEDAAGVVDREADSAEARSAPAAEPRQERAGSLFDDEEGEPGEAKEQVITYPTQLKGQRSESSVLFSLPHLLQAAAKPRVEPTPTSAARQPTGERFVIRPLSEGAGGESPVDSVAAEDLTIEVKPVEGPPVPHVPLPDPASVPETGRRSAGQVFLVAVLGVGLGAGVLFGGAYLIKPELVRSLFGGAVTADDARPDRGARAALPTIPAPRPVVPDRGRSIPVDLGVDAADRSVAAPPMAKPDARPPRPDLAAPIKPARPDARVVPAKVVRPRRPPRPRPPRAADAGALSAPEALDAGGGAAPGGKPQARDARPARDTRAPADGPGAARKPKPPAPPKTPAEPERPSEDDEARESQPDTDSDAPEEVP